MHENAAKLKADTEIAIKLKEGQHAQFMIGKSYNIVRLDVCAYAYVHICVVECICVNGTMFGCCAFPALMFLFYIYVGYEQVLAPY